MSVRLLLVEDDPSVRLTLSVLLEEEGFLIEEATSLDQARAWLSSPEAEVALVLLDHHLGDGEGLALVPAVREHHPGAKIVMYSGTQPPDHVLALLDAFVPKGCAFPELVEQLRLLVVHEPVA